MNANTSQFNAEPILLRHPSSFMIDSMYQQDKDYHSPTSPLSPIMDDVPQRLAPEQYQYEFPPKSHLQALSMQLDQNTEDSLSFFDASSFTTTTCTTSSMGSSRVSVVTDDFNAQEDQEFNSFLATLEREQQTFSLSPPPPPAVLVQDRHLSPLQLPQQAPHQMAMMSSATRLREESYDSISTITQPIAAPASFLAQEAMPIEWHDSFGQAVWQNDVYDSIHPHHRLSEDQDLPVIRRESEAMLTDDSSIMTDDTFQSHKVLFKLSKKTKVASPYFNGSDEGYYDDDLDDDKELLESASVFLPLDEPLEHPLQQQIDQLAAQLREEKAMRTAFEKAMEEMVLLMDQQQKMLYDRVDQEVTMRQMYEKKMDEALMMVKPLEQKLKKETDARCELESMMSHVLGELQEIKAAAQTKPSVSTKSSASPPTTKTPVSSRPTKTPASTRKVPASTVKTPVSSTKTPVSTKSSKTTKVPTKLTVSSKSTKVPAPAEKRSLQQRPLRSTTTKSTVTTKSTLTSRPTTALGRRL